MLRKLIIFFLLGCLILTSIPAALCVPSAPIIYVSGDGSGDFNCDGNADNVQINQALQFVAENPDYTTVYLKGPFTYVIDDTLLIGSNTILEGDSSATIKLVSNAGWPKFKPLIKERNSGSHDITIRGFTIDGNREGNTNVVSGSNYYNLIHLTGCQNVSVYNMYLTNNHGDGLQTDMCSNVKYHDNEIYLLGHDGLYAIYSSDVEAYNNKITCRTNSGLRLYNSNHCKLHDNIITSEGSGGAGIEIQKYETPVMDDIEVYNNVIYKTALAGIWIFGSRSYSTSSANVHIHHNRIYDTGTRSTTGVRGGIVSDGFNGLIENNAIDGAYGSGIVQKNAYSPAPSDSGYVLTVRNNIITNTRGGAGISNTLTDTHSFVLQNNCFYGNEGGSYAGVQASPSDIEADPEYADRSNHNYHLKSKYGRWDGNGWVTDDVSSPCIDAGYPLSDYSAEPDNNGGRINIGPDGGTIYASKSGASTNEGQTLILYPIPASTVETGKNLNFTLRAYDANGDKLTYSVSGLPAGANLDAESGYFSWTPAEGQEGMYSITFEVSDGMLIDSKTASINVVKAGSFLNLSGEMYDNSLCEASPGDIFRDRQSLDVGEINGTGRYRSLVWFNLSEYKDPEEVNSATLYLYWYSPESVRSEDTVIEIYRPASTWNSSYVSWNSSDNGVLWNNPGGDWFDKNNTSQGDMPYASITLSGNVLPDKRYYEFNVTDLVKEYISGKYENTGFLIKARDESNNYVAFYSSEGGDENQRPRLDLSAAGNDHAPVLYPIPAATVETGENLNFTLNASDVNGSKLIYSVSNLPEGASFDGESGYFSWTPVEGQEGTYNIIFEVSDGMLTDSKTASINVVKKMAINSTAKVTIIGTMDNSLGDCTPEEVSPNKPFIGVGGTSTDGRYRDLIWFNMSNYTGPVEIDSASLSLYWFYPEGSRPEDTVIEIYRPVSAWDPSSVSWNKENKCDFWNNSGGDWYDKNDMLQGSAPYATLTLRACDFPSNSYCEFNVTDLVKGYISGKYENTGFLIKARNESNNYVAFYSSNWGNENQQPKLNITCGQNKTAD